MFSPRFLLCVLGLFCAPIAVAHGKESRERLTVADRKLFTWFDQLGFEDFRRARLVRVQHGVVNYVGDKRARWPDEPRGFLLWENGAQFRALLGDLTVATFNRTGEDPKADDYVGWHAVSMDDETNGLLRVLARKEIDSFWDDGHDTYSDRMELSAQAFVLARYCVANRRDDLAARLLRGIERRECKEKSDTLKGALDTEIAGALAWRATLAWADAEEDRHALAARMQRIHQYFPNFYRADWIAKMAGALETMAIEDDSHAKPSAEDFARLAPADQARELVFQLRDDNRNLEEDWPRPWPFEPTRGNGAMSKLKMLGLPAVPALLEALKDERPTRSVFRNHRYGGGTWTSQVRDLAIQVLNDIAGVDFRWLIPHGGTIEYEQRWLQVRALTGDWWNTTREKGDLEWLRTRVANGEEGAQYCLDAIARLHPEDLPALAIAAIQTNTDPRTRAEMVEKLAKVNTPEVAAVLGNEMIHGPTLGNRVVAAYILRERQQPEAMAAMLAELGVLRARDHIETPRGIMEGIVSAAMRPPDAPDSPAHLLLFLLSSDSPLAIREVQAILARCDRYFRFDLLEELSHRLQAVGVAKIQRASPETRHAIEALLISELKDEEVLVDMQINGTKEPRVAEIAASVLAINWPDKYSFDLHAGPPARAAQLNAIRARVATATGPNGTAIQPKR